MTKLQFARVVDVRLLENGLTSVSCFAADQLVTFVTESTGVACKVGDVVDVELNDQQGKILVVQASPSEAWDGTGDGTRWRKPAGDGVSRMKRLWQRQTVFRAVREYFYRNEYLELQSPLLLYRTCPDAFLDSMPAGDRWLTTSTEYQIKRLWVGGFPRVFTLTQNFRVDPEDVTHNPEFTMLEWGRLGAVLADIEADVENYCAEALLALGNKTGLVKFPDGEVQMAGAAWRRMSVHDVLKEFAGVESGDNFDLATMLASAAEAKLELPAAVVESADALVTYLLDLVQPKLGWGVPLWVRDWPAWQTSSADVKKGAVGLADRSELFVAGVEIGDGFPALRDAAAQRAGFDRQNLRRREFGKQEIAMDEKYVASLGQGLAQAAGMAVGFDRLVMALTGAATIESVLAYTWSEM